MYKGVKKSTLYMAYLCCSKHENIAIKNDNVGKEPIILSPYNSNIIKILFIQKPLEKSRGLSTI